MSGGRQQLDEGVLILNATPEGDVRVESLMLRARIKKSRIVQIEAGQGFVIEEEQA